LTKRNPGKR